MKRNLIGIISLVVVSVLFNVKGAYAQSEVQANVPFAFNVGRSQLPAGSYRITVDASLGVIMFSNSTTRAGVLSLGQREYPGGKSKKLVFQHIGDRYFLTHIWGAPGTAGMTLRAPKPNTELEIASKRPPSANAVEIALK